MNQESLPPNGVPKQVHPETEPEWQRWKQVTGPAATYPPMHKDKQGESPATPLKNVQKHTPKFTDYLVQKNIFHRKKLTMHVPYVFEVKPAIIWLFKMVKCWLGEATSKPLVVEAEIENVIRSETCSDQQ